MIVSWIVSRRPRRRPPRAAAITHNDVLAPLLTPSQEVWVAVGTGVYSGPRPITALVFKFNFVLPSSSDRLWGMLWGLRLIYYKPLIRKKGVVFSLCSLSK